MKLILALLIAVGAALAYDATATSAPAPDSCSVTFAQSGATEQAHPTGCQGPNTFTSYALVKPHQIPGETLFDSVSSEPWVVNLPPCAWQVDFYDAGRLVLGQQGGTACKPPFKAVPLPTTTTQPPPPPVIPPPSTTTTTLAPTITPIPLQPTTTTVPPVLAVPGCPTCTGGRG